MTFLEKIVQRKKQEIAIRKKAVPVSELEQSPYFHLPKNSLRWHLEHSEAGGVIAEFKRQSPSLGQINATHDVRRVTNSYLQAGAAGLSVLTDRPFFGGSLDDLLEARRYNLCPVLRKDFILEEYQLFEAKAHGADVVLLIAECLTGKEVHALARRATDLEMEVLLEMHSEKELHKMDSNVQIIGINNRNLHDFTTDINTSLSLIEAIPKTFCVISESGISKPTEVFRIAKSRLPGFSDGNALHGGV